MDDVSGGLGGFVVWGKGYSDRIEGKLVGEVDYLV